MNVPLLVALLAALVVVLLIVRARQSPKREHTGRQRNRKSNAGAARSTRRRPEVPYVSASLRGMSHQDEPPPRRTSGLG